MPNPEDEIVNGVSKDDVWGVFNYETHKRESSGMVVADCRVGGHDDQTLHSKGKCPYFNDHVPWKSATVLCSAEQEAGVEYWLAYVLGGGCIRKRAVQPDGKVAIRGDYQCW